jgi:hydrogenase maturation protein HypF
VVQGVGFRPFVYRVANRLGLRGWVLNAGEGVQVHLEGPAPAVEEFVVELTAHPPPAAVIAEVERSSVPACGFDDFTIRDSSHVGELTVRVSPDLPVCSRCLEELAEPHDPRHGYPYINCTDCGPRYSIIQKLPYDRAQTTMAAWSLCPRCAADYSNPLDRRFHAQPVACPVCGPHLRLRRDGVDLLGDAAVIAETSRLLGAGSIVAIKGIGGYHLACDALDRAAVERLRERKFRKERPFALLVRDLDVARRLVELDSDAECLLASAARPIVLGRARVELPGVAPDSRELGVLLPSTPVHALLFAAGAPEILVFTSANRSSEPIAFEDADAFQRLSGLADAFLVGERPIARRIDDSIARVTTLGPTILRRARGYAPGAVASLPSTRPLLALGADLKNSVALVVRGQAFVSQHLGDLEHYEAYRAFGEAVRDLLDMYAVDLGDAVVVHDLHPEYASTRFASSLEAARTVAVQHHRAHVASVLAERGELERRVLGIAFDGTGFGDDGTIWGGEFFVGSVREGLERVAWLRPAVLPGGDAAARYPVQAAAGFLAGLPDLPDLTAPPFSFPDRFREATLLVRAGLRTFPTTSAGRLFDTLASLVGFTRPITYEGQAAIWLEQLAKGAAASEVAYPLRFDGTELDWRPLLHAVLDERVAGTEPSVIAAAIHRGLAAGIAAAALEISRSTAVDTVVLSGGVFQNRFLLERSAALLRAANLSVWINHQVPPNDGGVSLGQAALAAFSAAAA